MYANTQIIGRLGHDCDVRYMPSGGAVANFSVATDEKWKDKSGQPQERTTWYRCALFGPVVEAISQYLTKGQLVFCDGVMHEREWQNKEGQTVKSWEMKVNTVKLLGGRSGAGSSQSGGGGIPGGNAPPAGPAAGSGQIPGAGAPPSDDFDDDIPF